MRPRHAIAWGTWAAVGLGGCALDSSGVGGDPVAPQGGVGGEIGQGATGGTLPIGGGGAGATGTAGGPPAGGAGGGGSGGAGTCGDGVVDPGEACDDGNATPRDGCDGCVFDCLEAGGQLLPPSGHCYLVRDVKATWFEASNVCHKYGGTLAVINGDDELAAVASLITDHWVGLRDANQDGAFEWVTGEPLWLGPTTLDLPWKTGHPKAGEHCAKLKSSELESKQCLSDHGKLACEIP